MKVATAIVIVSCVPIVIVGQVNKRRRGNERGNERERERERERDAASRYLRVKCICLLYKVSGDVELICMTGCK